MGGLPLLLGYVEHPDKCESPKMIVVSDGWTGGGSIAVRAVVAAAMILAAASSISPLASLW